MITFFKKRKKARIKNLVRGYEKLKKNDNLNFVNHIKTELSNTPIGIGTSKKISKNPFEICLNQFLFNRLINLNFNSQLISVFSQKNKKLRFPLPNSWIKSIKKNGVNVDPFSSKILWIIFQFKWYLIGIGTGIFELIRLFTLKKNPDNSFVYFEHLSKNNFPSENNENNLIGWFLKQKEARGIKNIFHNENSINYVYKGIHIKHGNRFFVDSFFLKIKIATIIFFSIFKSLLRFKNRIMLREEILQIISKYSEKKNLANYYFFHNSSLQFKPLWTYEVESRGSKVILIQYSTNFLPIKLKNSEFKIDYKWNFLSWSEYWVWSKFQIDIFKKFLKNRKFKLVNKGVIPFSSKKINSSFKLPPKTILVFPVTPWRQSLAPMLGNSTEHYTDDYFIKFVKLIYQTSLKYNINVALKEKREINTSSKKYKSFIKKIKTQQSFIFLDSQISPFDLMEKENLLAVVSMPFTSTATIAKQKKIPSIYFDPTSKIDKNHKINNGIKLIQNQIELEIFLSDLK